MTISTLAPLVRGLFLNRTGRPVFVQETSAAKVVARYPLTVTGTDEATMAAELTAGFAAVTEVTLPAAVEVTTPAGVVEFAVSSHAPALTDEPTPGHCAVNRNLVVAGKVAVVTGGAQGFGAEIVRGLADSGAYVFIADMNVAGAEALAAELNAAGAQASAVAVNVTDEESVATMFAQIANTTGGLDLVVSNAGVVKASPVLDQEIGPFNFVTNVNYTGFMLMSKYAGRLMRAQWRTAPNWLTDIIQINSKSGLEGSNRNGAYAGSKFGGIGLVQSYALELVDYRIKVNAICPGNFFDGPLWSDPNNGLFVQYLNSGKIPGAKTVADVKAAYEAKVPLGRGATGPDVMRAIFYLVEQEYETGQAVPVTGGQVMMN